MAKFRYLNTAIWDDEWFQGLDALEQHLFIYFLTNTSTNITGIYQIALRRVAFDTGMDQEKVKKIIDRFQRDGKLFYELGWVVMKNWQRHQTLNPNQAMAVATHLNSLPAWLKERLTKPKDVLYIDFPTVLKPFKASETLTEPFQSVRTNPNPKLEPEDRTLTPTRTPRPAGGGPGSAGKAGGGDDGMDTSGLSDRDRDLLEDAKRKGIVS